MESSVECRTVFEMLSLRIKIEKRPGSNSRLLLVPFGFTLSRSYSMILRNSHNQKCIQCPMCMWRRMWTEFSISSIKAKRCMMQEDGLRSFALLALLHSEFCWASEKAEEWSCDKLWQMTHKILITFLTAVKHALVKRKIIILNEHSHLMRFTVSQYTFPFLRSHCPSNSSVYLNSSKCSKLNYVHWRHCCMKNWFSRLHS